MRAGDTCRSPPTPLLMARIQDPSRQLNSPSLQAGGYAGGRVSGRAAGRLAGQPALLLLLTLIGRICHCRFT